MEFPPFPVNDNLATVSIEGRNGNTPIFQWKIHHFPPFVKTSAKIIKFCKPSLTSWFNIKDHHSRILFILSFLLCNSIACNWLSCDLQSMAAYRWLCCLLYYKRNLQPSDWLIGKVLISYWPEVPINLLILKNSFSHTRTFTLKTCNLISIQQWIVTFSMFISTAALPTRTQNIILLKLDHSIW